ncbi:MAG: hypothetical protein EHM28_11280 [Spirochaetaceae bacterium]|nr:MAG: hypothetical protein EHM28_11280 [Spirochaetaceae bacterium]
MGKDTGKNPETHRSPREQGIHASNTELKSMIEGITARFENWRIETEKNPNPRMVHSLKNIMSLFDTVIGMSRSNTSFSYKKLVHEMSRFLESVAKLNSLIVDSLMEDDILDEKEETSVNSALMEMVKTAVDLIMIVQQSFGSGIKKLPRIPTPLPHTE